MRRDPIERPKVTDWCIALISICVVIAVGVNLARSQDATPAKSVNEWVAPDPPEALHAQLCHKDFVRCWRIRGGDWHIYHDEDKAFLSQNRDVIQWFALEGKLPR